MITPASFWFVFGGLWLAIGALFASVGGVVLWQYSTLDQRLARDGATVSGVVLSKSMQGGSNREPTFRVEYRFRAADGTVTEKTAKVDGRIWDSLVEGEAVAVTYVRVAPRLNRIPGQAPEELILGSVFAGVGGLLAVAGAFILWRAATRRKFVDTLLREGARADAEVMEVAPANFRINWMPQWTIRYRYRDLAGKDHDGKTPPLAQEEARRWQPGDRGRVRFERDRPHRSAWIGKE